MHEMSEQKDVLQSYSLVMPDNSHILGKGYVSYCGSNGKHWPAMTKQMPQGSSTQTKEKESQHQIHSSGAIPGQTMYSEGMEISWFPRDQEIKRQERHDTDLNLRILQMECRKGS